MAKANIPQFGVFTPYTLMLHQDATGEAPASFFKRSLILFDKLVIVPHGLPIGTGGILTKNRALEMYCKGDAFCSTKEFQSWFLLDEEVWSEAERPSPHEYGGEDDLWSGSNSANFIAFVEELVSKQVEASEGSITDRDAWEMKKSYIGNISHDYRVLMQVSRKDSNFSGLFSEYHEAAVKATFAGSVPNQDAVVRTVGNLNTVDFAQLTWEHIRELRNSGFVDDFRARMTQWVRTYQAQSDPLVFQEDLRQLMDEAKFSIISSAEPHLGKSILGAVAGNLPIPLVNPVGIYTGIKEIVDAVQVKKELGWMFFIQRAYGASRQTPP